MQSIDYENPKTPDEYDFGTVIDGLKEGKIYTRMGWNGDHCIILQVPDEHSKMNRPYIYIETDKGDRVPWIASQSDILSSDWIEVTE